MFLLFCQGTWQFRSALSLMYPWKPYRRSDDNESFIHVYLYLVFRYHATDVGSLGELVTTFFEGVSMVHGIKIGGDSKRQFVTGSGFPFEVFSNPKLQDLLDTIVFECSQSYSMIDLPEMRRRYGFGQLSPQPVSEIPEDTDTAVPDFTVPDDDMPRSKKRVSPSAKAPSRPRAEPEKDLSVVEGILSDVGDLVDLFRAHAMHPRRDKVRDQVIARQHQDVHRAPIAAPNRSIGSMSTSGTVRSQQMSSNASGSSMSLNLGGSHPGSSRSGPGQSVAGTSSDSRKRVRIASAAQPKGAIARNEQGPSTNSVHRDKRIKYPTSTLCG